MGECGCNSTTTTGAPASSVPFLMMGGKKTRVRRSKKTKTKSKKSRKAKRATSKARKSRRRRGRGRGRAMRGGSSLHGDYVTNPINVVSKITGSPMVNAAVYEQGNGHQANYIT